MRVESWSTTLTMTIMITKMLNRRGSSQVDGVLELLADTPGTADPEHGAGERALAMACLERVGLAELADARSVRLSGGQQQRVAIARALGQHSRLILADEPVASLDPASSANVLGTLRTVAPKTA
jgi:ABC-type polar amino acid transport system ATPase subunit